MPDTKINGFDPKEQPVNNDVYVIFDSEEADPNSEEANKGVKHKDVNKKNVVQVTDGFTVTEQQGNIHFEINSTDPEQINIETTSLQVGDEIVLEQAGSGTIQLVVGTGVTINNVGGLTSSSPGSGFRLFKKTSTTFLAESLVGGSGGGGGSGDMLKSVYDTGDNGKVDTAEIADEALEVSGISSAPTNSFYGKVSDVDGFYDHLPSRTATINHGGGNLTIDLDSAETFIITVNGNVGSFDWTGGYNGKKVEIIFVLIDGTNFNIGFASGKFKFLLGNQPELSSPQNLGLNGISDLFSGIIVNGRMKLAEASTWENN